MSNLVDKNSKIYFIGYQSVPLEDEVDLIFDIYNENVLSCRLYYRTKSPIPGLLKEDESGIFGELFDRYDLDLSENRIRIIEGNIIELRVIDTICYSKKNEYPAYIYIIAKILHNEAITIPARIHFYISFIVYAFQENFGDYDSYRKYVNWMTLLNINRDDKCDIIDTSSTFRTHHKRIIAESYDKKRLIETNTITFEKVGSNYAFDFVQLVNDYDIDEPEKGWNFDSFPENYFKIRSRKVTVLHKDWDVFKLLSGEYNRYVFLHYDTGKIYFVIPYIVK